MMNGFDDIDYLLNMKSEIKNFAAKRPFKMNSLANNYIEIMDTTSEMVNKHPVSLFLLPKN